MNKYGVTKYLKMSIIMLIMKILNTIMKIMNSSFAI